jgi:hypothetical protein
MASMRNCSEHIAAVRADGEADADLAGALGDGDEHDVHDADAADDERNASDGAEQDGHGLGGGGGGLGEFLLVADGEVGLLAVAALLQEVGDILLDPGHHFRRLGLDEDGIEIGAAGNALDVAGVGDDDDIVLVLSEIVEALGLRARPAP